ncbi:MAG: hypothetical protein IKE43_11035 [Coriobacteriales bacterium]|nr:hypothetical protein [Coriobacteriales bacterium]
MENKLQVLTLDQLDSIVGGTWDKDTLTYDELRRLDVLITNMVGSAAYGSSDETRAANYANFKDYVATLEEKYGPSGWDWMAMIFG